MRLFVPALMCLFGDLITSGPFLLMPDLGQSGSYL